MAFTLLILQMFLHYVTKANSLNLSYPVFFNFGDSNSDTGGMAAASIAYPVRAPNGQTFFKKPAGRFCDGRLIIDFLMEGMNLPFLRPYLDSVGVPSFKNGCNFATGGSTILPAKLHIDLSSPFSFRIQVSQFIRFKARALQLLATDRKFQQFLPSEEDFKNGLYMFDIGQDDIDFALYSSTAEQVFALIPTILSDFRKEIKRLYNDGGARNLWIHNMGPIGCLPRITSKFGKNGSKLDELQCVESFNEAAKIFNLQLHYLCADLRAELTEAKITYVDIYSIKANLIANYSHYGFKQSLAACCGYGGLPYNFDTRVSCGYTTVVNGTRLTAGPCSNTSEYVNWDGNHYTEAANKYVSSQILSGNYLDPPFVIGSPFISN